MPNFLAGTVSLGEQRALGNLDGGIDELLHGLQVQVVVGEEGGGVVVGQQVGEVFLVAHVGGAQQAGQRCQLVKAAVKNGTEAFRLSH
jgi:hypothetical protein